MSSVLRNLFKSPQYSDQQPFFRPARFSAIPVLRKPKKVKNLSLFFAVLCVVDLFGVFPIVSLPGVIIRCGLYGIPLALFIILLQIYTANLLGRCWIIAEKINATIVQRNRYPYAAVAEMAYGKYMSYIVTILLDLTIFGGGIPNILVASQNLQLLGHRVSGGKFYFSFCYWLLIIGVLMSPVMWLGSPKNMKALASISVMTVGLVTIITCYCIWMAPNPYKNFAGITTEFPSYVDILIAYGIMAFQFDIHPMLLTIQVDMKDKTKIGKAVTYGVLTTCLMSSMTTILAAKKFGLKVPNNLFELLPKSQMLYGAILLVSLQLCLSGAVGSSALFQHVENLLGISRKFSVKRCLTRTVIFACEIFIGELLPKFDVIMGLIGGTLTGPLIFILPPLFYRKMRQLEKDYDMEVSVMSHYGTLPVNINYGKRGWKHNLAFFKCSCVKIFYKKVRTVCKLLYGDCALPISVIFLGLFATIITTYFNFFRIIKLVNTNSPCFSNISYSFVDL